MKGVTTSERVRRFICAWRTLRVMTSYRVPIWAHVHFSLDYMLYGMSNRIGLEVFDGYDCVILKKLAEVERALDC